MDQFVAVVVLLLFVTVGECQCVDLLLAEDVLDGSEGASGQVTSDKAEAAGRSCTEASVVQKHFARNVSLSAKDKKSSITKLGHNRDLFEETGNNQSVNTLRRYEGHLYVSDNDNDDGNNTSDIGEGHVIPQHPADDADRANAVTASINKTSSGSTEGDLEDDENNFDRFLNDVSALYQNHITAVNNSHVKERKDVNLQDDKRPESHNQAMNESLTGPQLLKEQQWDSAVDDYISNAFQSEETFEQVFSISEDSALDSEARHCFGCQAGSERDAEQAPVSDIRVPPSDTELPSVGNGANIPALDNVFEVYHHSRSSDTSDPHVARHNTTLAERVEQLVLNRLPPLSNHTGNDDVESGGPERNDIPLDLEISPDETDERDEETQSGVSLAFVFDSTGSMWDDLVQVKTGAERIMATMLERPDKPIYNYVLVPFHDPSKSVRIQDYTVSSSL
jgi:hypothetical protein